MARRSRSRPSGTSSSMSLTARRATAQFRSRMATGYISKLSTDPGPPGLYPNVHSLTMILLMELGAKLVSLNLHSS